MINDIRFEKMTGTSVYPTHTGDNSTADDDAIMRALLQDWIVPQLVREYLRQANDGPPPGGTGDHSS